VPRTVAPALAHAQAALQGLYALDALDALDELNALDALDALDGLDALDALDALDTPDAGALQDEQDPTDSLWRAARRAFNRGDYASAAKLYGDLTHRYPDAARAGDALYWAAFALYKNDNLDRARGLLVTQQQRYPKAATLRDGDALLARIQSALATQGDEDAHRWVIAHAELPQAPQPPQTPQTARPAGARSCRDEADEDDVRVAAAQYLTRTEALLTGFRAEARSPSVPAAQFATQARDLLATTRLILDSPAATDARLKGLLEDLELVLAQIAQLPSGGSGDREDVQSINQGLDQRSVLLRLRTANPAGPGPVRTQGAL